MISSFPRKVPTIDTRKSLFRLLCEPIRTPFNKSQNGIPIIRFIHTVLFFMSADDASMEQTLLTVFHEIRYGLHESAARRIAITRKNIHVPARETPRAMIRVSAPGHRRTAAFTDEIFRLPLKCKCSHTPHSTRIDKQSASRYPPLKHDSLTFQENTAMTAARPEKIDAENAILTSMNPGTPYTIEDIRNSLLYPLDTLLSEALMELVLQELVSFEENCHRLTAKGIQRKRLLKQNQDTVRKRQHE